MKTETEVMPNDLISKLRIVHENIENIAKYSKVAIEVEPGKVYAITTLVDFDYETAQAFITAFKAATNATAIIFDNKINNIDEIVMEGLQAQLLEKLEKQIQYFSGDGKTVSIDDVLGILKGTVGVQFVPAIVREPEKPQMVRVPKSKAKTRPKNKR